MTTITIDRSVLEQALEALESSRVFVTSREKIKHPEGTEWYDERIAALRAALAQEQAEPVQEPVAWMFTDADNQRVKFLEWQKETWGYSGAWIKTPLYTAPPRRTMVPLTEEEIDAEWHELDGEASALFKRVICKFARVVEKAIWEKNK